MEINKKYLIEEYTIKHKSMEEISIELGTSPQKIMRLIHKFNIPINKRNGAWNSGKTYKDDYRILAKERHPRQKNTIYYNSDFRRLRKEILPCKCGKCENIATLLHHKDKNIMNNNKNNLQALCASCHLKLHHGQKGTTIHNKFCLYCGKSFIEKNNKISVRKFCSLKCSGKHNYHIKKIALKKNRKPITKYKINCHYCNKVFITRKPNQKFCCYSCASKSTHIKRGHLVQKTQPLT